MSTDNNNFLVRPILIVGAGVAGLQTARALLKRGFQVLILEQSEDVGGVWIRNYQGYGLQVPWEMYQFPEFPYPGKSDLQQYPSGDAVREYVQAYARHFGLYRHILFGCRLVSLRRKKQQPQVQPSSQQQGASAEVPRSGCTDCGGRSDHSYDNGVGQLNVGSVLRRRRGLSPATYFVEATSDSTASACCTGMQRLQQQPQPQLGFTNSQQAAPLSTRGGSLSALLTSTLRLRRVLGMQSNCQPQAGASPGSRIGTGSGAVIGPGAPASTTGMATSGLVEERCGSTTLEFQRTLMASLVNSYPGSPGGYRSGVGGMEGHLLTAVASPNIPNVGSPARLLSEPALAPLGPPADGCSASSSFSQEGMALQDVTGAGECHYRQQRQQQRQGAEAEDEQQQQQQQVDEPRGASTPLPVGKVSVPDGFQGSAKGKGPKVRASCGTPLQSAPTEEPEDGRNQPRVSRWRPAPDRGQQDEGPPPPPPPPPPQQLQRGEQHYPQPVVGGILSEGLWEAEYEDSTTGRHYKLDVSYCVLCTGLYATPFIPSIPGQELYRGLQVHSRDFTDASVVAGKRVLVVGAGKTAVDIITELTATSQAASVTLLYRRPHWPLPRSVGPVSMKTLAYTRLMSSVLLPHYYDAGVCGRAAATCLTPLRKAFWIRFMVRINQALGVKKTLGTPARPICQDIWYSGQVLDAVKWPEVINNPKVIAIQGEVDHLTPVSALLRDGTELDPDVVLYATGYSNHYTFLEPDVRTALNVQHDGLYLYRHCLVPGLAGLAFVGAEVSTFNNILTAALQAEWLAAVLAGAVVLPSVEAMAADVRAQQDWRRCTMPPHKLRGSSVMLYMQRYHDQLIRDMGLRTHRKRPSWRRPLAECFEPYTAEDYGDVFQRLSGVSAGGGCGGGGCGGGGKGIASTAAGAAPGPVRTVASLFRDGVESETAASIAAAAAAADATTEGNAGLADALCVTTELNAAVAASTNQGIMCSANASWCRTLVERDGGGSFIVAKCTGSSRFQHPGGWPPSAPGPSLAAAAVSRGGVAGLVFPFSASMSAFMRLLPGAQLGGFSSTGPDRAMLTGHNSTAGPNRTQLAGSGALQGAATAVDSPPYGRTSSALCSMARGSLCNTGPGGSVMPGAASVTQQPLIRAVLASSVKAGAAAAGTAGGGSGSPQEGLGSGPAWRVELQDRGENEAQSSARPLETPMERTEQSGVSAVPLDEQDTLYSLDALPTALQAYRRTRARVPTAPGMVTSGAAAGGDVRAIAAPPAGARPMQPGEGYFGGAEDAGDVVSPFVSLVATKYREHLFPSVSAGGWMVRANSVGGDQAEMVHRSPAGRVGAAAYASSAGLHFTPTPSSPSAVQGGVKSGLSSPCSALNSVTLTPARLRGSNTTKLENPSKCGVAGGSSAHPSQGACSTLGSSAGAIVQRRSSGSFIWSRRPTAQPSTYGGDVTLCGGIAYVPTATSAQLASAQWQGPVPPQSPGPSAAEATSNAGAGLGLTRSQPVTGFTVEGPLAMPARSVHGLVLARDSGGSVCSAGSGSTPRRTVHRGFSLATLLMRARNTQATADTVYGISSSRIEPSSSAVSELAYKVLPPRHVEEAMAASAVAAVATAVPVGKVGEPPTLAAIAAPLHRFGAPSPLAAVPPPLSQPPQRRISQTSTGNAPPLSSGGTDRFSPDMLLLPAPPSQPAAAIISTLTETAAGAGVSGSHVLQGRAASATASSSGISYMPSSSGMSFPHWGDAAGGGGGNGGGRQCAAYYIDHLHGVLATRASASPAVGISGTTGASGATSGGASGRTASDLAVYIEAHGAAVAAAAAAATGAGSSRWMMSSSDVARGHGAAAAAAPGAPYSPVTSSGVSYVPTCSTVAHPLASHLWQ